MKKEYELSQDSVARLRMTGIPDLGIRADIMGPVLDPLLCVFLAGIQSVGIGACMHVCVLVYRADMYIEWGL